MNKISWNKYQNVCSQECVKLFSIEIRIETSFSLYGTWAEMAFWVNFEFLASIDCIESILLENQFLKHKDYNIMLLCI